MPHYAQINDDNIVIQVAVIDQATINTGLFGDPQKWIPTSYNTYAGKHLLGGIPVRKNFAGVGYTYDPARDAFIPPRPPFESWTLNEQTCQWDPPVPMPQDGQVYEWDEANQRWNLVSIE